MRISEPAKDGQSRNRRGLLGRAVVFSLLALLPLIAIHGWLHPFWGNPGLADKLDFLQGQGRAYDRVFFGSSRIFRHVSPHVLDSALADGGRSFNSGFAATYTPEAELACAHFLRTAEHVPDFVFVELNMFKLYSDSNIASCRDWYMMGPGVWMDHMAYILGTSGSVGHKWKLAKWASLACFKSMALPGFVDQWSNRKVQSDRALVFGERNDGFVPLEFEEEKAVAGMAERRRLLWSDTTILHKRMLENLAVYDHPERAAPHSAQLRIMRDLAALGRSKGTKVVFILPPFTKAPELLAVFNQLPENARIDLCDPRKYPELYTTRYAFDKGHLNSAGSYLLSVALARELKRIGSGQRVDNGSGPLDHNAGL